MKKRLTEAFLIGILLTGCASMQQAYQEQVCNQNGGYERGMNEARAGQPMNQGFAQACDPSTRDAAIQGYHQGYAAGLESVQGSIPATQINLNFGNSQPKNFYCEIHAFTETFSAWGSTELEARVNAKSKCTAQYNEMHCNDISCRQ